MYQSLHFGFRNILLYASNRQFEINISYNFFAKKQYAVLLHKWDLKHDSSEQLCNFFLGD